MQMLLVLEPYCLLARLNILGRCQTVSDFTPYYWKVSINKLFETAGQPLLCIIILTHEFLGQTEKVNY